MVGLHHNAEIVPSLLLAFEDSESAAEGEKLLGLLTIGKVEHAELGDQKLSFIPLPRESTAKVVFVPQ